MTDKEQSLSEKRDRISGVWHYYEEDVKEFMKKIENAPKKESRVIETDIGEYEKFVNINFIKKRAGPKLVETK